MEPASAFSACEECRNLQTTRQHLQGQIAATMEALHGLAGGCKPVAFANLRNDYAILQDELQILTLRITAHQHQPH